MLHSDLLHNCPFQQCTCPKCKPRDADQVTANCVSKIGFGKYDLIFSQENPPAKIFQKTPKEMTSAGSSLGNRTRSSEEDGSDISTDMVNTSQILKHDIKFPELASEPGCSQLSPQSAVHKLSSHLSSSGISSEAVSVLALYTLLKSSNFSSDDVIKKLLEAQNTIASNLVGPLVDPSLPPPEPETKTAESVPNQNVSEEEEEEEDEVSILNVINPKTSKTPILNKHLNSPQLNSPQISTPQAVVQRTLSSNSTTTLNNIVRNHLRNVQGLPRSQSNQNVTNDATGRKVNIVTSGIGSLLKPGVPTVPPSTNNTPVIQNVELPPVTTPLVTLLPVANQGGKFVWLNSLDNLSVKPIFVQLPLGQTVETMGGIDKILQGLQMANLAPLTASLTQQGLTQLRQIQPQQLQRPSLPLSQQTPQRPRLSPPQPQPQPPPHPQLRIPTSLPIAKPIVKQPKQTVPSTFTSTAVLKQNKTPQKQSPPKLQKQLVSPTRTPPKANLSTCVVNKKIKLNFPKPNILAKNRLINDRVSAHSSIRANITYSGKKSPPLKHETKKRLSIVNARGETLYLDDINSKTSMTINVTMNEKGSSKKNEEREIRTKVTTETTTVHNNLVTENGKPDVETLVKVPKTWPWEIGDANSTSFISSSDAIAALSAFKISTAALNSKSFAIESNNISTPETFIDLIPKVLDDKDMSAFHGLDFSKDCDETQFVTVNPNIPLKQKSKSIDV